jgi:bis(5'-nucleosyl)-tetraphosphatase (symmetrical)
VSTYVVGDIQGCLEPLKCLLQEVNFDRERDVLWSVGDVINRGPDNLGTLRFMYELRDSLVLVLGNHDLHLLAVAAGIRKPSRSDTLDEILAAPDKEILLAWLQQQPLMHRQHGYLMVHAGIPPQWSAQQAMNYAGEVHKVLQGPKARTFLQEMYGNEPHQWSADLKGMERLRVITNYLTRMRYCTADGTLDLQSKGPAPDADELEGQPALPWFSHESRQTANVRILFGHWAAIEGMTNTAAAIGLDTGCVWGGTLSLFHLESGTITRCACSKK